MPVKTTELTGALLVDKPAGPTSHDVVAVVRRALHTRRVGHTGTLDPLATGLLVLLVGPATRLAQFVAADDKEYIADVRLGAATPTYDAASRPVEGVGGQQSGAGVPSAAEIDAALARFRGTFLQTPPPFSAKKVAGVPAHERARKQQPVDLAPIEVSVRELERLEAGTRGRPYPQPAALSGPADPVAPDATLIRLRVASSPGFYVRSLAHDLGAQLGCGAHLEALRRIRAGRFSIADALALETILADPARAVDRLMPPGELLGGLPAAALNRQGLIRALHGNALSPDHLAEQPKLLPPAGFVRLCDGLDLVGVARAGPDGLLHPVVVLAGPPEVKY